MKIKNLHDCFVVKVMALYDIENQISKSLPKVIKSVDNDDLKEALTKHLAETDEHIVRLEKIFELMSMKPKKLKAEGIKGIIEDVSWCMDQDATPATMDTMTIAAARYVENYEIAGYTTLLEWADMLNMTQAEELISETLEEERMADQKLVDIMAETGSEANMLPLADDDMDDEEVDEEIIIGEI